MTDQADDQPQQQRPILPTESVHFVLDTNGGLIRSTLDDAAANKEAREIQGLVISWPVASDYRPKPVPEWAESARMSGFPPRKDEEQPDG